METARTTASKGTRARVYQTGRGLLAACGLVGAIQACSTVPVTGRSAFNVFSPQEDMQLGAQAYSEELAKVKVDDSRPEFAMVKRVSQRIAAVADAPADFEWEVHLIVDDKVANAWCMPGGKMAVYTGILPLTRDETGLAVVMGHEIAHAVARHGTERISTEGLGDVVLSILADRVGGDPELWAQGKALGFSLPWSRRHELEADRIGLIYMARAGYDPRQAAEFWKRMSAANPNAPPKFLSTHPPAKERIDQINDRLPEAVRAYEKRARP